MKAKLGIVILIICTISCKNKEENKKTEDRFLSINRDALFEKKIPVLTYNLDLKNKLDLIIEKEVNCSYYKKDITCFGIRTQKLGKDKLLSVHSINYYLINFSDDNKNPDENFYGYFKYKGFMFFCLNSCKMDNDIFMETKDSVKVKNSIYLHINKRNTYKDDSHSEWWFKIKQNKLIEDSKTVCN